MLNYQRVAIFIVLEEYEYEDHVPLTHWLFEEGSEPNHA